MALNIIKLVVGPVYTNCYIAFCSQTKSAAIIDPGDNAEKIIATLEGNGLTPEYIFLTHGHFDHIMALSGIKKKYPAKVIIHESDADRLTNPVKSHAPLPVKDPPSADITVTGGEDFSLGNLLFHYIHTPGHTKGSCVISCEDTLFTGDTLFSGDCGRCDLPGGDYSEMLRSLKLLYSLSGEYRVLPGHDEETTLERERRVNPNMLEGAALED